MEVAGSAVGIASLGITVCQGLLDYCNDCKDYESDISGTRASLADLRGTLALLNENLNAGGLDNERTAQVSSCLQSCTNGLQDPGTKLDELKKYSKPEGRRQKIRAKFQKTVYPFHKDTLDKLRGIVADVRERLNLALQVLQLSVQQSDRWRKIVAWLSAPDPWTNHQSACDRHEPDTGKWLLQSTIYRDWKAGTTGHLWISGKAGCGKTVLSYTMIEDIRALCDTNENLGKVGLGAFYFTFSDKQKQSYEDMLRSLVVQLAWKKDGFDLLQQAYDDKERGKPRRVELEKILLLSLKAYETVYLALDALDESPEENNTRQDMLLQLEELVRNSGNVKIVATSREERRIEQSMVRLGAERIKVAKSKVNDDIRKYVASELSKDPRLSSLTSETTELIKADLSSRADGMFRWAYCQIQELKELEFTKLEDIKEVLAELPATLDGTYERMLCAIKERYRPLALALLRWITYSKRPLSLKELAEAAIIDPCGDETVDIDKRRDFKSYINIFSGLILVYEQYSGFDMAAGVGSLNPKINPNSKVRLAHFSVKEYLESKRILDGTAKDFHLHAASEHRFLARSCLTYLMHYSNDTTKLLTREDQRAYPLLDYSANTWYYHSSLQSDGELEREIRMLTSAECLRCWLRHSDELHGEQARLDDFKAGQAIYLASCAGLPKVVEELLARDADVNAQGSKNGNALQGASFRGFMDIVELLLARGADINASGGHYGSALQAASFRSYNDIVERLLTAGADVNAQGGDHGNALQAAATSISGSVKDVERLLVAGADVNAQGGHYGSALQAASCRGSIEVVEKLLAAGADVNAQGSYFGNALQAAAYRGSIEVVGRLLSAGADVNAQGGKYGNALQAAAAAHRGSIEKVERLLAAGADVNAQGGCYGNALHAAERNAHEKVEDILLAAGAVPMKKHHPLTGGKNE
ncbi:hypothetical protein KC333_g8670 [Hortaea werneckii]|nr:hypothetical protein KC333_g8670 [Hortaea werneckii]KAI7303286.1 hypothetical protein KC326_g8707 [Hortaea werneckii]